MALGEGKEACSYVQLAEVFSWASAAVRRTERQARLIEGHCLTFQLHSPDQASLLGGVCRYRPLQRQNALGPNRVHAPSVFTRGLPQVLETNGRSGGGLTPQHCQRLALPTAPKPHHWP
jgi:hypothetical protein